VIQYRRSQLSFADGLIAEEVTDLWEPWMRHADQAIDDDQLLEIVHAALSQRCKKSKTRGRPGAPAEAILRLLLLKHIRDWSYEELAREVRANLVYREFTRIGGGKVPDDKSMSRFGRQLGPEAVEKLHRRVVSIAQEKKVVQGRKLRVDTTVVETNIHYPTDSGLLNDGARVLTRTMKKIAGKAGGLKRKVRDRTRSVSKRVMAIAQAVRHKGMEGERKRQREYRQLLRLTRQILNDSRRVLLEVEALPARRRRGVQGLGERLETMADQVPQSSAADQGPGFRRNYAISGQTAEPV